MAEPAYHGLDEALQAVVDEGLAVPVKEVLELVASGYASAQPPLYRQQDAKRAAKQILRDAGYGARLEDT